MPLAPNLLSGRFPGCILALSILALAGSGAASASEKVLHSFKGGTDGAVPWSSLIADSTGNLYGTTAAGGDGSCQCGTVFKVTTSGTESVLHRFVGGDDGANPFDGLVFDGSANLYGTTAGGGGAAVCNTGCGTIFKITSAGAETVLYSFQGGNDGSSPVGSLIFDKVGNLYGTTQGGGDFNDTDCTNGCGTVFKLKPDGTKVTVYAFQGGTDGAIPFAGLIADKRGNLFGTTNNGGNLAECAPAGCGVVFKVTADGNETVLYTFHGGADGARPESALVEDSAGNLYGTTNSGGNIQSCFAPDGCGTVFKLAPDGTETALYAFQGGSDGSIPVAGLVLDKAGNFYGTTYYGGGSHCHGSGCGTVFKLAPDGTETVLHAFGAKHGANPTAALLLKNGLLYGTALAGGPNNDGVVFSVKK